MGERLSSRNWIRSFDDSWMASWAERGEGLSGRGRRSSRQSEKSGLILVKVGRAALLGTYLYVLCYKKVIAGLHQVAPSI